MVKQLQLASDKGDIVDKDGYVDAMLKYSQNTQSYKILIPPIMSLLLTNILQGIWQRKNRSPTSSSNAF